MLNMFPCAYIYGGQKSVQASSSTVIHIQYSFTEPGAHHFSNTGWVSKSLEICWDLWVFAPFTVLGL